MFDPVSLGVNLGISIISASITARANRLKSVSQFQRPTASESRKLPYIAGTVLHKSANLVWWGDFKRSSVNLDLPGPSWVWGPVALALQSLPFGYRYYIGMAFALSHSGDDAGDLFSSYTLQEIRVGGKTVWSGAVQDSGAFTVEAPGKFGNEGGVYATGRFERGAGSSQARNTYLNGQVTNTPAYQNSAMVYWHGPSVGAPALGKIKYSGYVSRSAYIKPFSFRVRRLPWAIQPLGYFSNVGTNDANPAHVIWDLLTSNTYGAGIPASQLDFGSFNTTASQLRDIDEIGCSFLWDTDEEVLQIIQALVDLGDLALYTDPSDGKIHLDPIREYTGSVSALTHFNESNSSVLRYGTRPPDKVANEIKIKYTDIAAGFVERSAEWRSIAMRRVGDNREPLTIQHLGISNAAVAQKIASRDGLAYALPLKEIILRTNRDGWDKVPGEPVRFSWADYGITDMVCRVAHVDRGNAGDGMCEVTLVEDRFRYGQSVFGEATVSAFEETRPDVPVDSSVQNVLGTVTTLPGSPATGDSYMLSASNVDAPNGLATWNGTEWIYREADDLQNTVVYDTVNETWHQHDSSEWTSFNLNVIQEVQEEGTPLTGRSKLNFIGTSVTAADDSGNARTNVTVQAYNRVQDEGSNVTQRDKLNFIGAGVSVSDDAVNGRTDVTISSGGAPADATYITQTSNGTLTNEQALSSLATGILKSTTATGVVSIAKAEDISAPVFAADAGSNDTYTATLSPAPAAYVSGTHYRFKANTANTGACTINFNGLGAKTIKKAPGGITTDLDDNDIRAGQWVDLVYDGTNMQMQSTLGNAGGGSGITQLTGDVTAGPGSGSQAATIANDSVTYGKMQDVSAASRILGRGSAGGSGNVQELTLGPGLSMSGTQLVADGSGGGGTTIVSTALGLIEMIRGTNYQM